MAENGKEEVLVLYPLRFTVQLEGSVPDRRKRIAQISRRLLLQNPERMPIVIGANDRRLLDPAGEFDTLIQSAESFTPPPESTVDTEEEENLGGEVSYGSN